MLKKLIIVSLTVGNTMALANGVGTTEVVEVPCGPSAWTVGASALYLKTTFGGNGLGYSSFSNYGTDFLGVNREVNGAPNELYNILPKRDWGFEVEVAYNLGNGNDANLNWYHLSNTTKGTLPVGSIFAGSASGMYASQLNVRPSWDAINLEFGQCFEFDSPLTMRLHAGVEYARVKTSFSNYPQLSEAGPLVFATKDTITYNGFGPRIGGDFIYDVGCGFGAYAKAATSLLVGRAKQSVNGYYDVGGFNLYSTGNYHQSNSGVIVPEFEAKLGLQYDYVVARGNLKFDLGYMLVTYLNSLVSQVGSGVVSSSISNSSAANFDLNGVYFGVTWNSLVLG